MTQIVVSALGVKSGVIAKVRRVSVCPVLLSAFLRQVGILKAPRGLWS